MKIVNISFNLLTPVALYDVTGAQLPKLFVFYYGTYEYFGKDHRPYACLALFMLPDEWVSDNYNQFYIFRDPSLTIGWAGQSN